MAQLRFKVGDRVVGKEGEEYIGGKVGTVVDIYKGRNHDYGIQFDEPIEKGHELGDPETYKVGHCRWVMDSEIDPYVEPAYFADLRVGDSVYDMAGGDGLIETIKLDEVFPLRVRFKAGPVQNFTLEGKINTGLNQTLFYSKPVFNLPPPPKRTVKVKKIVEGWVNRYKDTLYSSEAIADEEAANDRLGKAVFIRHEYEGVEE